MSDNFVITSDHAEIVSELTDEQAGKVFKALFQDSPELDDIATRIVYKTIKAQVERYRERYNKRSEAGKKGMQSRYGITNDSNTITSDNNVVTNDNNEQQTLTPIPIPIPNPIPKPIKDKKHIERFTPPDVEEVRAYIAEKGYSVDAETFVDFYSSKGWMVGKSPMKDWKSAVRNWNRSQRQEVTTKDRQEVTTKFSNFPQRTYDYDDLERRLTAAQWGGL